MDALKKLDKWIAVEDTSTERGEDQIRSNEDLDPTPSDRRTWKMYNYILIWAQSAFNVNEWNTGASLMKASGLPYGQTIGSAIFSIFVAVIFTIANARAGSTYHIGYPTLARATFGVYGAYFFVAARGFVAIIWFSVQSYYGSMCLDVALRCMFGHKWLDMKNHLPASADVQSRILLAFFLFWLIQFPLMFVHPRQIRHFFTVKSFVLPCATIGLLIFCVKKGHGPGNYDLGLPISTSSSAIGWGWMSVMNSIFGTISPMIINQPDIARYAKKPSDTILPQAIGFVLAKIMIMVVGMVATASIYRSYGEVYWNMWDLMNAILDHSWNAGARTGVFFVAVSFGIGTAGTNIFGNSIPFACDITGLLPKYFTILRGQIVVAILAWAIVPWKFLTDAAKFLTFLGSYSIFVGPILGCMLADYYFVKRGNIHVPSLFTKKSSGVYHYVYGWNLWACFAWAGAASICIPGLYRAYYPESLSISATRMYQMGYILTTISSMVFYYCLSLIFKPQIYPEAHRDTPKTWEYMRTTDGFFEDDSPIGKVGYFGSVDVFTGEKVDTSEGSSVKTKSEKILETVSIV
ncbi:hypothetical protein G9P44_003432 [Scheffersomyces stipitis]|nr:hypothetical protein G9P44_003432 [Scheffersomyces stipitis]